MEKKCPYFGASLLEEASFCPHCARSINARKQPHPPRYISGRALRRAGGIVGAAVLLLAVWLYTRPRTYDTGTAEVLYPDKDGTYQVCIAWADAPFSPFDQRNSSMEPDFEGRYPVLLYVNHTESDSVATKAFLDKWDHATAEIVRHDEALQISCTQPEYMPKYVPDATAVTFLDYSSSEVGDWSAELVITLHMKNGDKVRVHQEECFHVIPAYHYTSEDVPLDTLEDLTALVEQINETAEDNARVYITLPPVTYEGRLTLDTRAINLIGSEDEAGNRTTFTGPVQLIPRGPTIFFFENLDFVGDGDGIGLSISNTVHLTGCRIAGWRTGVLAYGDGWVNADECVFEDNETGLHFNLTYGAISDSRYEDNIFRNNGTAVLLENTGTEVSLKFPGTSFIHNGADIDNRCNHELELDGAVFE